MHVERVALSGLILDPSNARRHSPKNLEAIKGSLARFGQQKPIVVSADGIVVAGNGTLEAARALGWSEIDVHRTDLTGTDATAFAIADNRTGELAEWDPGVLSETLKSLQEMDFDLSAIGFDADDLTGMIASEATEGLTDPEAIPEVTETRCKPGDLWTLGGHRLLCGDSTDVLHVERLMGGEKADLCVTDPPYNVAYTGKTADALKIENDSMSARDFRQFLSGVFASVLFAARPGAPVYVFGPLEDGAFLSAWLEAGLKLQSVLVWLKNAIVLGRKDYHYKHEPIFYGWVEGAAHEWHGERDKTTVLECQKPPRNGEHPTMKPVELLERLVKNSSRSPARVLDLFLGSGSTLIACEKTGRRCFGMEIDPAYCDVILARWEQFTGKEAILTSEVI